MSKWEKEIEKLKTGSSDYEWDELEELITDDYDEGIIDEQDFLRLMDMLMQISP